MTAILLVSGLLAVGMSARADSTDQLKHAIEKQKSAVAETRDHQKKIQKALAKLQVDISQRQTRIDRLTARSEAIDHSLHDLNQQQDRLQQRVTTLKQQVAKGLRAAYQLGDSAAIGALLARSDALSTERDLHYIHALVQPTLERLDQLHRARHQLQDNRQDLVKTRDALAQNQQQLTQEQQGLQSRQIDKQKLLAQLDDKLAAQSQQLQQLLDRKRALDDQVAKANRRAARQRQHATKSPPEPDHTEAPPVSHSDAIPVGGKIIRHYGTPLGMGGLHAQGLTFSAPANEPVRAVDNGKVVYAGHLKGWGNLVILRHAHNYLSLYAHDDKLSVKVGMRVKRGQIVGTTGQVDAHHTGMYFEVRHGDDAINPAHWHPYKRARTH